MTIDDMGSQVPGSILAVDDNRENLRLLVRILSDRGYVVRPVLDGATALASANAELPDLILLDVQMPGMDGYEVCRRLRDDPRTAAIPVIFVSAASEVFNKVQAFEAGGADYLTKPFESAEILVRVEAHIRLHRLKARVEAQNLSLQAEVAERKRAEQALQDLNQHLEAVVGERTKDLIRSNGELYREIEERILIEKALCESEARFRRLHESMRDAFASVDMAGHIQDANPAFQEMLRYDLEELQRLTYVDLTPPRWHASEAQVVKEQILVRGYSDIYEKEYVRRDGKVFPVELRSFLLADDGGEPIGIWAIVRDITERKRAEAQIESALREKEVLLKEIHHRVKNNLQVVSGLLDLQAREIADPAARALLGESSARVRAMALVHELLYGAADLSSVAFDAFLDRLISQVAIQQHRPEIVIGRDLAPAALCIEAAVPCGLIVNELVSNAFKHAFPGGRGGRVDVALECDADGAMRISVSDDGVGLPPDFSIAHQKSMGWQLIVNLIDQIDGEILMVPGERTVFALVFRQEPGSRRIGNPTAPRCEP
ncbi:response regulator [Candidatus Accumulibacter vicinus]|uniref:histidine kinase n=1 Tax=Candidatus Accumulibacter vicinus TaxID=2954382 RepID=A0A084Y511_9PROT|nr:response regulator [Candidatus Accumulibacter vicinus]KFB69805.1 MAG: Stalked cell differentiation-controlling protein [Candidatus Accumulibacter vicinus]